MTTLKEATREALEFLRSYSKVGVLATVDEKGQPYASSVYFVMGHEFEVFFLTTKNTNKTKNIESNNKVAFSVGTGPEYIEVMIRGKAVPTDASEQNKFLPLIADRIEENKGFSWPVRKLEELKEQNLILYKISPEEVTFLNINSSQEPKSATDHLYHLLG